MLQMLRLILVDQIKSNQMFLTIYENLFNILTILIVCKFSLYYNSDIIETIYFSQKKKNDI